MPGDGMSTDSLVGNGSVDPRETGWGKSWLSHISRDISPKLHYQATVSEFKSLIQS